jgi:hypothetical protein
MDQLFALCVAVPLLAAAATLAARPLLGKNRRVLDLVAVLTSAGVAVMPLLLLFRTKGGDSVYWLAGFRPVRGAAPWLTVVFVLCTVLAAGAVLRVAFGVFYGLGDPPREQDPPGWPGAPVRAGLEAAATRFEDHHPALPERRHQRLRDVARDGTSLPGRRAGAHRTVSCLIRWAAACRAGLGRRSGPPAPGRTPPPARPSARQAASACCRAARLARR